MPETTIYTIGYGGRTLGEMAALLQQHSIAYLIDVRSQPYSRQQPEFGKRPLLEGLKAHGIQYVFMGMQLGGRPEDARCYTEGHIDYAKLSAADFYRAGIGRLHDALSQGLRVALMCSERDPAQCHRSLLIGDTLAAEGVEVRHIGADGGLLTQAEVMALAAERRQTPPAPQSIEDAQALLQEVFGYGEFRPLQADIIQNVLAKKDSLIIMPTGSGKSICYQLPALLFEGLTVVVSPLISLMQDQVDQLQAAGVAAVYLNSTLGREEYEERVAQLLAGEIKLLYLAPETLLKESILDTLTRCRVECLTIDEAHCISAWGHDFRPEYRQLMAVRQRFPTAVTIALTATATARVQADIKEALGTKASNTFVASFNRPNLFLQVRPKENPAWQTLEIIRQHQGESGIVYCFSRRAVDELTDFLQGQGVKARPYHAGMENDERQANQNLFIRDEVDVIVATVAFGMGINKPDVRFVVHHDLPKNIESYYQQIGRAGRDGLRADCVLLFGRGDIGNILFLIGQRAPELQAGDRERLDAMVRFGETFDCRRVPLLAYFGEAFDPEDCEMCDNCLSEEAEKVDLTEAAQKFLSCVKRTGELFGVSYVAKVLRGSQAQDVVQRGHHLLTTHGIGREFSEKEWGFLARQFIQQGLLTQNVHGGLALTERAYAVFNGEVVKGVLKRDGRTTASSGLTVEADDIPNYDPTLFEMLRQTRKRLADEAAVPPYVIFADRSLIDMAAYFPQSEASFLTLHGVGRAKLEKYGEPFLKKIRWYCRENEIAERPKPNASAPPPRSRRSGLRPRTQQVVEAVLDARSLREVSGMLGIKPRTIVSHLEKYAEAGQPLDAKRLRRLSALNATRQDQVMALFNQSDSGFLRPVYDALGGEVSYDELSLLRLVKQLEGDQS